MTGTASQIEWAEQIKPRVAAEFDRVTSALMTVAATQRDLDRAETETILGILAEKREQVMANHRAGYFIQEWRDLSDQVRRILTQDSRHQAIQASREARRVEHTERGQAHEGKHEHDAQNGETHS
jgi:hypothetical protein